MRKTFNIISAALFFSVTVLFAVGALIFSDEKLILKFDSSFTDRFDSYIERSFPLTANFRSMYSSIITASGQEKIGDVYISPNGLIEIISKADERKINERVDSINAFAERHPDVSCYALIVPTASGIYAEQLPNIITSLDQQKLIDDIYYRLDTSIHTLDAYNPLFQARDDYVYFRTDSRWTEYGAYTVYNKVIKKMGFTPLSLSSYDMEYADRDFYGNLYSKTYYKGVRADFINIFRNKNGSFVTDVKAVSKDEEFTSVSIYYTPALSSDNKLDVFLGGDSFERYDITTSNTNAPSLLMIKGSFANMFVPFLTPHYSKITLIDPDRLDGKTIEDVVDVDSYDQMLILYDMSRFC